MISTHKPIFILGSHKSGSSLLRSLLDGHPELFVIPSESHYFQLTGHCVEFRIRRTNAKEMSFDEKRNALTQYIHRENISTDPHGAVMIENRYNENIFKELLEKHNNLNDRDLMSVYLSAFHAALYETPLPENIRIVEKSVEHAEFAPLLARWFPDAKFIHIVRNPYATLAATRQTDWQKGYPYLGPYIESMRSSYCHLFKNVSIFENYKVIRYEDLVTNTSEIMQSIAEHLEIRMDNVLLQPTLCGEPWAGNSSTNTKFSGVSSAPSEKWKKTINDLEIILTNRVSKSIFSYFQYQQLSPKHHPLRQKFLPIKGETPGRYIKNRALLLTI